VLVAEKGVIADGAGFVSGVHAPEDNPETSYSQPPMIRFSW
jgi:hypothetical protein